MIELPKELLDLLVYAITFGVTWLVVEGVKELGEAFGKDFSKPAKVFAAILSAAAVSAVTGVLEAALGFVPAEYAPVVQQVLNFLVVLFSAIGIHHRVSRNKR